MNFTVTAIRLVFLGLAVAGTAPALELVRAGKAASMIVIPEHALPVVKFAAEELQHHVERATGAKLPVVIEGSEPHDAACVYLGACAATARAGVPTDKLEPNAYVIRLLSDQLYMAGDDSDGPATGILINNLTRVGTLFAVYEFLEKELQVRWLWPGELGTVIPRRAELTVTRWDSAGKPAFVHARWRDGGGYMGSTNGWSSAKARDAFLDEQSKWLRRHRFARGLNLDASHAFTSWWGQHKDSHPEYFSQLPDGSRRPDPTYYGGTPSLISMCVSEPNFHRAIVEHWRRTRTPQQPFIDASENDTDGKCTCPRCLAWDAPAPELAEAWSNRLDRARKAFAAGDKDWDNLLGSLSDRYAKYFLAVQAEAEKTDPGAVVLGYAYANYASPPRAARLNERIIIGVVPPMYFPWTDAKREYNRRQWEGWAATGARLMLRPNWMLDGHNLPMIVAHKLGEDFRFFAQHGMIATDFDSLTGQFAAQGPNLYMLARLHDNPNLTVEAVLAEFYSGFGKAAGAVRDYFTHWENVCAAVQEAPKDLDKSHFYRAAAAIFTPETFAKARELMRRAQQAARGDELAERRVNFVELGLRHAELTLATQRAHQRYVEVGDIAGLHAAVKALDEFRRAAEPDLIGNYGFLDWAESRTWNRRLLQAQKLGGERLPDPWKFAWDSTGKGEAKGWHADALDPTAWPDIGTDTPWEDQPVGKQWQQEHGTPYPGSAWYRTAFQLKPDAAKPQVRLVFGAVDEACTVWVNGQKVLTRSYPFQNNQDSWREPFEVDITGVARRDRSNSLAVRVENRAGAGGIWRPVWLVCGAPPAAAVQNAVPDGGFENGSGAWRRHVGAGDFEFTVDTASARTGKASARLRCVRPATKPDAKGQENVFGRWYQTGIAVDKAKTYRLRVWARTAGDFRGKLGVWLTGDAGGSTLIRELLNTEGMWREIVIENIRPKAATLGIYLNLTDAPGTAWFDDLELTPEPKREVIPEP